MFDNAKTRDWYHAEPLRGEEESNKNSMMIIHSFISFT